MCPEDRGGAPPCAPEGRKREEQTEVVGEERVLGESSVGAVCPALAAAEFCYTIAQYNQAQEPVMTASVV